MKSSIQAKLQQNAGVYDGSIPLHDPRHEHFAAMVAAGKTLASAYKECGYNSKSDTSAHASGTRLLRNASVASRIAHITEYLRAELDKRIQTEVVAAIDEDVRERRGRVEALCARRRWLLKVIAERSVFEDNQDVPGGKTGLVVSSWKSVGVGKKAKLLKTHTVDIDVLKELRAIEQQIAMERGQWVEKREDVKKVRSIKDMEIEELEQLVKEAEEHSKLKAVVEKPVEGVENASGVN